MSAAHRLLAPAILAAAATACRPGGEPLRAPTQEDSGLAFEPAVLELGPVLAGGAVEGTAWVRNVTDRDVTIVDAVAPCECTVPQVPLPRTLRPGESLHFPVAVDLSGLPRGGLSSSAEPGGETLRRTVELRTDRARSASLSVKVTLDDSAWVSPTAVDLGRLVTGTIGTTRLDVGPGRGHDRVHVLSVGTDHPLARVRAEQLEDRAVVHLDWGPFREAGPATAVVEVLTDLTELPARVRVEADVVDPVRVQPAEVVNPRASPTRPVVEVLTVSRWDGAPVEVLDARADSGRISCEVLADEDPRVSRVRVVVGVPPPPGEVDARVTLEIDGGEAKRLVVPVRVRARPRGR